MEDINKFHDSINNALLTLGKAEISLKEAQYKALKTIVVDKKDSLVILPTGYGKSLIYQTLPFIFDYLDPSSSESLNAVIIVVSPLNALMQEQVEKLRERVNTIVLQANDNKEINANCKIIFAHPEVFVSGCFRSFAAALTRRVKAIVIDEAHLVVEWKCFRPAYAKVSILSSYFPHASIVALTATATVSMQKEIMECLGMSQPAVITVNPDRANIYFASFSRPSRGSNKLHEILEPLAEELKTKRHDFPLTLIYGNLETISECYLYFSQTLGTNQYDPPGAAALAKNRLFTQFHAQYPEHERKRIVLELANEESKLRVLFVTVSFGIGIDIKNIRRVIHIGVPYSMEEYFQEAGRCGRDGLPSQALIYFNSYDISTAKRQMSDAMRKFVQESKCKREMILTYFGHKMPKRNLPDHTCCDFHMKHCKCNDCVVNNVWNIEDTTKSEKNVKNVSFSSIYDKTFLTDTGKEALRDALVNYRLSLHGSGPSCVGGVSLATGFSMELIDMIVLSAEELTSVNEIKARLPIFSDEHAKG